MDWNPPTLINLPKLFFPLLNLYHFKQYFSSLYLLHQSRASFGMRLKLGKSLWRSIILMDISRFTLNFQVKNGGL